jgi:acetate---CoA ligase (ADP-forming)
MKACPPPVEICGNQTRPPLQTVEARPVPLSKLWKPGPSPYHDRVSGPQPPFESDVVLRDGSTVRLRPMRPDDVPVLRALAREHTGGTEAAPSSRVHPFPFEVEPVRVDATGTFVLIGEAAGTAAAVASYTRDATRSDRAEVMFAIVPALQGRGLGTRMLEVLARIAWTDGIRTFDAWVRRDNDPVMGMFVDSGFETERQLTGGLCHVVLSLAHTAGYRERAAERSEEAATASMKAFFEPRTVAVVGAGRDARQDRQRDPPQPDRDRLHRPAVRHPSVGHDHRRRARRAARHRRARRRRPRRHLSCRRARLAGRRRLHREGRARHLVSSAPASRNRRRRARARARAPRKVRRRASGWSAPTAWACSTPIRRSRSTRPSRRSFRRPAASRCRRRAARSASRFSTTPRLNIGFSTFVSVGNKADVSGNDLLQYWEERPATASSCSTWRASGTRAKFSQIARRVGAVEADRRRQVRAVARRRPRGLVAHRRARRRATPSSTRSSARPGSSALDTIEELFDVACAAGEPAGPAGRASRS